MTENRLADMPRARIREEDTGRNSMLDLSRLLAAFGIVWAHALAPGASFGYVALSLFLVLTAFLAMRSMQHEGGMRRWRGRNLRILAIWLVAALAYRMVEQRLADAPMPIWPLQDPYSLLVGPTIHLWFLPFILLASLAVWPVLRLVDSPRRLALAVGVFVVLSLISLWQHDLARLPIPGPQWAFSIPAYFFGLLAARAQALQRPMWPLAGFALVSALVWAGARDDWAILIFVGAAAFEILWRIPLILPGARALGDLAIGIYLSHPFFMLVVYKFMGPDVNAVVKALLCFVISALATAATLEVGRHLLRLRAGRDLGGTAGRA